MITHDLRVIADAILDKKGQNVVSLDLRPVGSSIADYFVVCNADSTTNVNAIADNILKETREELGMKPLRTQGMENNFWIILDYGNIVVHVFLTEYREFYRLEDLWADAPKKEYKFRKKPVKKVKEEEEL
ncbi:MAG: ribosome silencing factor [Bacteroidales bacterium]|nr:ribosome silencing factor [Bacteroidales bacterium]